jgi:hypothetical protein
MGKPDSVPIDPEVLKALEALGVDAGCIETREDAIHRALVAHWKKHGKPPTGTDLARATGIALGGITGYLWQLQAQGRVLHPRKGVWVPVVEGDV